MKKITLLTCICFFTFMMSCSSSDSDDEDIVMDCATCNETEICYEEGQDFYTVSVDGGTVEMPLNGMSWTTVKADFESNCN